MLDHGILNIPLSIRGDIDSQIDKFKKEQAEVEARKLADRKFTYAEADKEAKAVYATLTKEQIKFFAKKYSLSVLEARIELTTGRPEKRLKMYQALKTLFAEESK